MAEDKTIAFVLYPGLTLLDLAGPLQVISALARSGLGYRAVVVGEKTGAVDTDTPLGIAPSHTFDEVRDPFAIVVPGGASPTLRALGDERLLGYLRETSATAEWTTSVCTGSLLLGAAGLLEGKRATTHWLYREMLRGFGAVPVAERWVEDTRVITAAGVSAGIDMALYLVGELAGDEVARNIQFLIEYDPAPPLGGLDWDLAPRAAQLDESLKRDLADNPEMLARLLPYA